MTNEQPVPHVLTTIHFPHIHTSRFGVILKHSQPGRWRLFLDLSSPEHHSVNDGISTARCSMKYTSVDKAVYVIAKLGRYSFLAKIDIVHAYHNVPIHHDNRYFLGMHWEGYIYIDTVLSFGFRSATKIFSSISDPLEWILQHRGIQHVFYCLDDFLTFRVPDSNEF